MLNIEFGLDRLINTKAELVKVQEVLRRLRTVRADNTLWSSKS